MANIDYLSNYNTIKNKAVDRIKKQLATEVEIRCELRLELIDRNPFQPRIDFSQVEELAASIRAKGQDTAIIVRASADGRYEVADGETRLRAMRLNAERFADAPDTIGCIIKSLSDLEMAEIAFRSNYQRKSFNPVEEAKGLEQIKQQFNLTIQDLAKHFHKPEHYFVEKLRLLSLPEEIQNAILSNKINPTQGVNLYSAKRKMGDDAFQELLKEAIEKQLTTQKIREKAKEAVEAQDLAKKESKELLAQIKKNWEALSLEAQRELCARVTQAAAEAAPEGLAASP